MVARMKQYSDLNCAFELKSEGDSVATFTGVASTSDTDSHNDIIEAGAFEPIETKLAPNGELIPNVMMLRDHDRAQVIGGWRSFEQQGKHLIVQGELALEVPKARETYALMKRGYLSGLSVGFSVLDRKHLAVDERTGRRTIRKALLQECSIVGFPANRNARIVNVKSEIDELLADGGFDEVEGIGRLLLGLLLRDARKPFGDVEYADPGYQEDKRKRYPIDTEGRIRAAWNYIHKPSNQSFYSREQVDRIKARIVAAWKRKIDPEGPPAYREDKAEGGFADPGYLDDGRKRHPIDTEAQIRAAWKNIHDPTNRALYSREQVLRIEERIIAAWKAKIDPEGPPRIRENNKSDRDQSLIKAIDDFTPIDEFVAAERLRGLIEQLKGRGHAS